MWLVFSFHYTENDFQVGSALEMHMMIRTTDQRAALLLAVSSNAQNFFAVDIYDGSVSLCDIFYWLIILREKNPNLIKHSLHEAGLTQPDYYFQSSCWVAS